MKRRSIPPLWGHVFSERRKFLDACRGGGGDAKEWLISLSLPPRGAGQIFFFIYFERKNLLAVVACKKKILCNFRPQKSVRGPAEEYKWVEWKEEENAKEEGGRPLIRLPHAAILNFRWRSEYNARGFPPMQEGVFKLNMFFFPFFDSFQTNIIKTVERVFSTHYSLF